MKYAFLLFSFIASAYLVNGQAGFAFKNSTVAIQNTNSGKYLFGHNTADGSDVTQLGKVTDLSFQTWELQEVDINNGVRYAIFHKQSQRYLTITSPGGTPYLAPKSTSTTDFDLYQTFEFDVQTVSGRYKIHTVFNTNQNNPALGVDYVLAIQNAGLNDGAALITEPNQTTGNSDDQRFDLIDMNPAVNPSSAIPSLEDKFQDRTIGIIAKQGNLELKGDITSNLVKPSANFANFDQEFKIESTNETGWYRIKHKPSGLYVTVILPIDGGDVQLKPDAGNDPHQRFKFIFQSANTYEIHSKYSATPNNLSVGLVLQMVPNNNNEPMQLGANLSINNPWQQFVLSQYMPLPARFNNGVTTDGQQKILGKQYYMSNYESLALLEPYIVGTDTFVRVQPTPVYGEQSEWTFDDGIDTGGHKYFRLRYGKTGQYLYVPVSNQQNIPGAGTKLMLKADTGSQIDLRFNFHFDRDANVDHTFGLVSGVGQHQDDPGRDVIIDDEGNLVTDNNTTLLYVKNRRFFLNPSLPLDGTKTYSIVDKVDGHFASDSGILNSGTPVVHQAEADYSCNWYFIPVDINNGIYQIKNNLTGQFLSSTSSTYASTVAAISQPANNNTSAQWQVTTEGNYYRIKNVATNFYLGTIDHPETGQALRQGLITDAGTLWVISRSDYFQDVLPLPLSSTTLLSPYNVHSPNAFSDDAYRNQMMQSIGLPFEPKYERKLYPRSGSGVTIVTGGNVVSGDVIENNGFNPVNPPEFYPVLRAALTFKYNYNSDQVDSAMKNFRVDSPGHRVLMAFALRSYILENLSLRARSTWTYNEQQLVTWLEKTKVKSIKVAYADSLEKSWDAFKINNISGGDLPFDILLGPDLDYTKWRAPDYYTPTASQSLSLYEFCAICRANHFSNSVGIINITVPGVGVAGASIMTSLLLGKFAAPAALDAFRVAQLNQDGARAVFRAARKTATQLVEEAAFNAADEATNAARATYRILSSISSIEGASVVVSVAEMAIQLIIMKAIDEAKFLKFENQLKDKVSRLRNDSINVNNIMQSNNVLNKFYICQDLDYVFGSGMRFDNIVPPVVYEFNGNGKWSDAANWKDNKAPLDPNGTFLTTIDNTVQIVVNPAAGGECVLDLPILVSPGGRITVNPGKTFRVASKLGGSLATPGITN